VITIERKKGPKDVDLKQVVDVLRLATEQDRARVPEAQALGLPPLTLYLRLKLDGNAQVKPHEVLSAILKRDLDLPPIDLIRVGLWRVQENQPLSPLEPVSPAFGAQDPRL
jgi:hypothetical protein